MGEENPRKAGKRLRNYYRGTSELVSYRLRSVESAYRLATHSIRAQISCRFYRAFVILASQFADALCRRSPQADEELLKDSSLPPRKRMAVIVRLCEKRILRATRSQLENEFPAGSAPTADEDSTKKKNKRSRDGQREGSSGKKSKVK